jgi:hypothetical protein
VTYGAIIKAADGSTILDVSTFAARLQGLVTVTTNNEVSPFPFVLANLQLGQMPFFYAYSVGDSSVNCWIVADKIFYQTKASSAEPVFIYFGAK